MRTVQSVEVKPIHSLLLVGAALTALFCGEARAQQVAAGEPLTVDRAVDRVLERSEVVRAIAERSAAARAAVESESEFDNPEVSYEREQLLGGTEGESEDVIGLSKTFEISGARRLRIEAAEHGRRAIEAAGAKWRVDLEQDTRLMFYRSLYRQQRADAFASWIGRLERVVAEVGRRAAAGDVSNYDRMTLSRELAFARAEAADRAWVPDVTLSAGYKTAAAAGERGHGFAIGISAPLPFLSQGRGARDEAAAVVRQQVAERALVEARLSGELRGRTAETTRLFEAAVALRRDLDSAAQGLPEIAETAYRGGELGVLELVDAHRGHLESVLRSLELELAAREARIELDRLTGGAAR